MRERKLQSMNFSNNQEDSSASSTTNTTQDITRITNDYGPVHTLLEICKNDMIHEVYKCMNDDVIFSFVECAIGSVIGRRLWKKRSDLMKLRNYVTPSDEAFAMLVLENNAEKWMDEFENPGTGRKDRCKARYTEGNQDAASPNTWGVDGIDRYMDLWGKCTLGRSAIFEQQKNEECFFEKAENIVLQRKRSVSSYNDNSTRTKKRMRELMMMKEHNEEEMSRQDNRRKKERKSHTLMMRMAMGQDVGAAMISVGQDRNINTARTYVDVKPEVNNEINVDEHYRKEEI